MLGVNMTQEQKTENKMDSAESAGVTDYVNPPQISAAQLAVSLASIIIKEAREVNTGFGPRIVSTILLDGEERTLWFTPTMAANLKGKIPGPGSSHKVVACKAKASGRTYYILQ